MHEHNVLCSLVGRVKAISRRRILVVVVTLGGIQPHNEVNYLEYLLDNCMFCGKHYRRAVSPAFSS